MIDSFFEKSLHTLEFDKVLETVAGLAVSDGAKSRILKLRPAASLLDAQSLLDQTFDAVGMIERRGSPPFYKLEDPSEAVRRAQIGGALSIKELIHIGKNLKSARRLADYAKEDGQETGISPLFDSLTKNRPLEDRIDTSFISEEEVSDDASHELRDIRRRIKNANAKVRDILNRFISSASYKKYLQDPIVTMRSGRYVIPVKSEFRQMVPGLLHDTSSSGATLFIEPTGVIEANNEIRALESDEQREIERILYELSSEVANLAQELLSNHESMLALDEIFARAKYSLEIKGFRPLLSEKGGVSFHGARHPLLNRSEVVPIDIELGDNFDTLVITGPNTGGKTVALKTLGLFCALSQSGIFPSAKEHSRSMVFENIFADIGDEQSIEQSLSTFSSHLKSIRIITERAGGKTLALFDELGAGTDPEEGAALAIAIIEDLREKGALIAATTHYGEIKLYALETNGVENASCEFDVESLRPTYKLLIGVPGKSNALAISERLGLSPKIIESARRKVKRESASFEDILGKMEEERIRAQKSAEETQTLLRETEAMKAELEREKSRLASAREDEISRAKQQAAKILENARRLSEEVLSELETVRREKDGENYNQKLEQAKGLVKNRLKKASDDLSEPVFKKTAPPLKRELMVGDAVFLLNLKKKATVLTPPDKNGNLTVQAGLFKISSNLKELILDEDPQKETTAQLLKSRTAFDTKTREAKSEIDVRGQYAEDALLEIAKFIDSSVLMGLNTVTIIHGKGTGALRKSIHEWLKGNKLVRAFRLGVFGEGEDGITIVELK